MIQHVCGLDFGTSNSAIGVWKDNHPTLVPVEGDEETIPSAIFFDNEIKQAFFGRRAMIEYIDGADGRLLRALKSILGSSLMAEKTLVWNKLIPFEQVVGTFVKHLKSQAEQCLDHELTNVVVGRPVQFVDGNKKADTRAQNALQSIVRSQGFTHVEFLFEPIAAALDYEQQVRREEIALVIDIGGGTSDFSIVRVSPDGAQKPDRSEDILANQGIHIGGTDFDRLLSLKSVMPSLGYGSKMNDVTGSQVLDVPGQVFHDLATWYKINFLYNQQTLRTVREIAYLSHNKPLFSRLEKILKLHLGHHISDAVEQAKILLTDQHSVHADLSFLENDLMPLATRTDFNTAIESDVYRLGATLKDTLTQAQLRGQDISTLFFTGGSTSIPLVHATLAALVPEARQVKGNMFGSIGMGLTLDAKRKFGTSF